MTPTVTGSAFGFAVMLPLSLCMFSIGLSLPGWIYAGFAIVSATIFCAAALRRTWQAQAKINRKQHGARADREGVRVVGEAVSA